MAEVKHALSPEVWMEVLAALNRPSALFVLLVSLSMLALGLRAFRYYVCFFAAAAAWAGGTALAKLMYVSGWYVGLPAAAVGAAVAWPVSRRAVPAMAAFFGASGMAVFVTKAFELPSYFWAAFAGGSFVGLLLGVLAPRFSAALVSASIGSLGIIATLGAVFRAPTGPFSPGGFAGYPLPFLITATVLFVCSLLAQTALDHDHDPTITVAS